MMELVVVVELQLQVQDGNSFLQDAGGDGGAGATTSIKGSPTARAGGGGGGGARN